MKKLSLSHRIPDFDDCGDLGLEQITQEDQDRWPEENRKTKSFRYLKMESFLQKPPKFNTEPENNGVQINVPFPGTYFQVPMFNLDGVPYNKAIVGVEKLPYIRLI